MRAPLAVFGGAILALALQISQVQAGGPSSVAIADQTLWPEAIRSRRDFDRASRAEILAFLSVYRDLVSESPSAEKLGVKRVNSDSVRKWMARSESYFLAAFREAARNCKEKQELGCGFEGTSFTELMGFSAEFFAKLPDRYQPWLRMTRDFHAIYVKEQLRLAALFPSPTSEILPLEETEVFGDRFKDGEFLLTLDDGPILAGGLSDQYATLLRKESISGYFFSLGSALETRIKKTSVDEVRGLYSSQCLASHGWEHKSHQRWTGWADSLAKTHAAIQQVSPGAPVVFRPPYGQRSLELVKKQRTDFSASVMLWNIDSQDWHSGIRAEQVGDRMQKLMLLWRKGILLFHDVHPKGLKALPQLFQFARESGLRWVGCKEVR